MNQLFVIDGVSVRRDFDGRYCLNDLHRAAGVKNVTSLPTGPVLPKRKNSSLKFRALPELQERPRWSPLLVVLTRGHSSARSWFIPMQCGSARNLTSKSSERSMPYRTLHQCADIRQNSGWRDPA
jgi:hypothetical protein